MANLSQIKLPNGTTYSLKDNGALQLTGGQVTGPVTFGDSVVIDEATIGDLVVNGNASFVQGVKSNQIVPFMSKTFTGVIASANSDPAAFFYFAKVLPTSYQTPWKVRYKLYCTINGVTDSYEISYVTIYGCKNTYYAYQTHNTIPNTSYRPIYYHLFYSATTTGITNRYGHLLGVGLRYAYNPATTANARVIKVDILETEECEVTFFDSMILYANAPGTGTTNYNSRYTFDATTNGYTESGDRNDVNYNNREYYGMRTASTALYRYQFCFSKLDGTLVPANAVNNSVATNKTLTTESFNPFGDIFYWNSTSTYNAETNVGDGQWYRQILADLRYSFNVGGYDTTSILTARQPLYLVCDLQSDGLVKLHSVPLSQSLPNTEDGLLYIYLGRVYPDNYPYRVALNLEKPIYWYKNGAVRQYSGDNLVTQTATTTDAAYEILFSGTADNTTRTEGARKTSTLKYNPSTKNLTTGGQVAMKGIISNCDGSEDFSRLRHNSNEFEMYLNDMDASFSSKIYMTPTSLTLSLGTAKVEIIEDDGEAITTITNLTSPTNNSDAATKSYVDTKIGGSGTSGYLAKFSGTRSLTNGPLLGSSTTTFLRNDGSWATPAYPVTSVNSKTGAVSLTASDVGALASNTTYVSTVTTTAGTHTAISSKSGAVSFNVPTKTSHLTNDSGFLTSITHQTIKQDGVTGATGNHYGACSTTAGTAAKTVSITAGTPTLEAGLRVIVKFANANTAGTPTLNVNSLGAKNIFHNGAQITTGTNKALLAGTVEFVYDGTQWQLVGNYVDTDTKAWGSITDKPTATGSSTTGITIANHGTGTVIGVQSSTTTASKVTVGSHSTDYGVTAAGSASSWTFEEITIPNVTAAGSGGASLIFIMDTTDTKKLKITFSHTHTAPTIGTAIKVQSKSGGANGTAPTLGSKVPTVSASDVTVPIKNTSASTFVTGTTHTITDNGHTHTI